MQEYLGAGLIFLAGIAATTLVDIVGSITSRKFNFNYGYFTVLSIVVYTSTSCLLYIETDSSIKTITLLLLLGFYDGIVGWRIAKKLKANNGRYEELAANITDGQAIIAAMTFALVCGGIGIFLAGL